MALDGGGHLELKKCTRGIFGASSEFVWVDVHVSFLKKSAFCNFNPGSTLMLLHYKPVLLYGCEVWTPEGAEVIEKLHLRFCKHILSHNKSTCSNMVYGELGTTPLLLHAQSRMIML